MAKLENLRVKIINEKYLKNTHVLEYKKDKNTSWQWAGLMDLREGFKKEIICQVGDVNTIKF